MRPQPAKRNATEIVKKAAKKDEASSSASVARGAKRSAKRLTVAEKKSAKNLTKDNVAKKVRAARKKSSSSSAGKVNRECVPGTKFLLNEMRWSEWKLAMCPRCPDDREVWQDRRGSRPGVRNVALFSRSADKAAIYGFALRRVDSRKKYVMYSKVSNGFEGKMWDTALLGKDRVQEEIDNILDAGCELYVRRAVIDRAIKVGEKTLRKARDFSTILRLSYDYAWRFTKRGGEHVSHRQVSITGGISVSSSDIKKCTCVMCS